MKWGKFLGAVFIFVLLLIKPEEAVSSAQRAMQIWYSSVAPALFPFLALMPLLSSKEACMAYEKLFAGCMRKLFRLPGSAAPAVLVGMIAGSPGGAIALRSIAANSKLTQSEARRIALAIGGVSPAYLIVGIGQRLHGSAALGMKLAIAQMLVQLFMLAILPSDSKETKLYKISAGNDFSKKNPITSAVESILSVCGYMVLCSVISGVLAGILGKVLGSIMLLVMDLPSGLETLAKGQLPMKMLLQGAAIGFTGLCIIFQNMNALEGLQIKWSSYIGARTLSAALLALAGMALEGQWRGRMASLIENARWSYAISLLIVGILALPGLYFLSIKYFLNIRKGEQS